jgi:hypothetical protein
VDGGRLTGFLGRSHLIDARSSTECCFILRYRRQADRTEKNRESCILERRMELRVATNADPSCRVPWSRAAAAAFCTGVAAKSGYSYFKYECASLRLQSRRH